MIRCIIFGKITLGNEQPHKEVIIINSATETKITALYIRLSQEDIDRKDESCSITNQRKFLLDFIKDKDEFSNYEFFIDDGITGTTDKRPGFIKMMNLVSEGKVYAVIVKDLSRLARIDYIQQNSKRIFAAMNVRYIAVMDMYDSFDESIPKAHQYLTMGIKELFNNLVPIETSDKINATLNVARKNGEYIGSFPCYGYIKDPNDHHKLIIDEEPANVVRYIFDAYLSGVGICAIARNLCNQGVLNPTAYKMKIYPTYKNGRAKLAQQDFWHDSTVRRILCNEFYIGSVVQGKSKRIEISKAQQRQLPQEKWINVADMHEAIIDKDKFDRVQAMLSVHKKLPTKSSKYEALSGFVRCAECGRAMSKKTNNHSYGTYKYYRCTTRTKYNRCENHSIRIDLLEEVVLTSIQKMVDVAIDLDKTIKQINQANKKARVSNNLQENIRKEKEKMQKAIDAKSDSYVDYKLDNITKDMYESACKRLDKQIEACQRAIEDYELNLANTDNDVEIENSFVSTFKKYGKIEKLTSSLMHELVEEILVSSNKEITIRFKFEDEFKHIVNLTNNEQVA